ncbi:MAG: methylmalonyl-CoA mutase family protein [Balneolaceae bacterium]
MDSIKVKEFNFLEFPPVSTEKWEAVISRDLKGKNYKEELLWSTLEGADILPFYRSEDLDALTHKTESVTGSADWHIIEKVDIPNLIKANKQALHSLENGASGLLFDPPSSSINSKAELGQLLKDVRVDFISLHFGADLSTQKIIDWLKEICTENELDLKSLNITFSFDPFARAVKSGKLARKEDLVNYFKDKSPFKTFAVDADFYGNCGGGIVQQLAFSLAEGNEYLAMSDELNLEIPEVASKIHFNFSTASAYFLEIAKYRAFRLVWAQILNAYENYLPDAANAFIHAKTASWNKTFSDAHNNIIRATTEAMSAALGGSNAITVERFDEDFAGHSEFSARVARNIQLILQGEAYLNKVSDAGAGSYYIEVLTDKFARESWKLFQEIEKHGGFYEAINTGFIQQQLSTSQNKRIDAYQENQSVLVGVNKYEVEKSQKPNSKSTTHSTRFPFDDFYEVDSVSELRIEHALKNGGQK